MKYKVHFSDNTTTFVEKLSQYSSEGHGLKSWKPQKDKTQPKEFIWICVEAKDEKEAIEKAISMADVANNQ
ncbi:MAG: hypothetical protein IPP81_09555 [Chitinophagaceae bacterium]|nr:hypothetical protein [Chitinophagaceae bacterium]